MRHDLLIVLASFVATVALGMVAVPFLRAHGVGQHVREDGPARHLAKSGIPTMGGIFFIVPWLLVALSAGRSPTVAAVAFVTAGAGLVGFLDDFRKWRYGRSLGLRARTKLLLQVLVAVPALMVLAGQTGTMIWVPFGSHSLDLGVWFILFGVLVIVGATNAVNLTDGIDGLAAGTTAIALLAYAALAWSLAHTDLQDFALAGAGAMAGFLVFNFHPARVFMGDVGSLALGGALAGLAIATRTELLLVVVGGVFVVETLSVVLQVFSFRVFGRRLFRMSPLHHHFELAGWGEVPIVLMFYAGAVVLAWAGLWLWQLTGF